MSNYTRYSEGLDKFTDTLREVLEEGIREREKDKELKRIKRKHRKRALLTKRMGSTTGIYHHVFLNLTVNRKRKK